MIHNSGSLSRMLDYKLEKIDHVNIKNSERLRFRSQFVLGPDYVNFLPHFWKKIKIDRNLFLTIHPDLNCSFMKSGNNSLILIGHILDPDNPSHNNEDILSDLLFNSFDNFNTLIERTFTLGGRWILIVKLGEDIILFNDASGLRQVFYTDINSTGSLWCASQPGLIADILGLAIDGEAHDFIKKIEPINKEYWWPGNSSPFKEIKHLLPNHYIHLNTGAVNRYWPNKKLNRLSLNMAVERISRILKGLACSMYNRFDLALSITAGLDSRVVLASFKDFYKDITCITLKEQGMSRWSADIRVPKTMLSALGVNHDIVNVSPTIDDIYSSIFKNNVAYAHDIWLKDAYAIFNYNRNEKVAVVGSVSEIGRCFYKSSRYSGGKLTGSILSSMTKMNGNHFAATSFNKWLKSIENLFDYNLLDLFYWEQRVGNWLAMCQLEFDLAWKDIFSPFNCRELIVSMLSVDEEFRSPPHYKLHKGLILNLWPELLDYPINPPDRILLLKKKVSNLLWIRR